MFIRGAGIYKAQLNAENPVGTIQSIEYALRGLDKAVSEERERAARAEKMLGDFQEQAGKPFEHEARLKELLARQAELNAALDLDKGERQIAPPAEAESGLEGNEGGGVDEGTDGVAPPARRRDGGTWRDRPGRSGDSVVAADADKATPVGARGPVSGPKF
jgi:hypothetical protein